MSQKRVVVRIVILCLFFVSWGVVQSQMSSSTETSPKDNVVDQSIRDIIATSPLPAKGSKILLAENKQVELSQEPSLPQLLSPPQKVNPIENKSAKKKETKAEKLLREQKTAIDQQLPKATVEEKEIWLETLSDLPPEAIRDMLRARNSLGPMIAPLKSEKLTTSLPKLLQPPEEAKRFTTPSSKETISTRSQNTLQTGIVALQQVEQVLLNNIVNASTIGFKRTSISLTDLPYDLIKIPAPFMEVGDANNLVENIQLPIGFGVLLSRAEIDLSQGKLKKTGRSLDVAIEGDGFFQVTSDGGEILYTRNGQFSIDADGKLIYRVVGKNFDIEPLVTIPANSTVIHISSKGIISIEQPNSKKRNEVGQLQLVKFPVSSRLKQLGGGLYAATKAAGEPMIVSPRSYGTGRLQQGFLECSNVNMKKEVATLKQYRKQLQTLLELQRELE